MLQADFTSILQKAISIIKTKGKKKIKIGEKILYTFKICEISQLGPLLRHFFEKKVVILFHGSSLTNKNDNNGNKTIKFRRKIKKS
jgi:hypothetical protein